MSDNEIEKLDVMIEEYRRLFSDSHMGHCTTFIFSNDEPYDDYSDYFYPDENPPLLPS